MVQNTPVQVTAFFKMIFLIISYTWKIIFLLTRFIFSGILIVLYLPAYSQSQPGIFPLPFVKFTDNYTFDNPSAASFSHPWDLKLVNSFYTGLLNNVGFYYLDASCQIKKNRNNHTLGLMVFSEYETEILKRTRVYGRYAWSSYFTPTLQLSAGVQGGFFNFAVKSTGSSAGASAIVPDGTAGIWLKGKRFNAGISAAQLTGAEVKPVNQIMHLDRYFVITANYSLPLSAESQLIAATKAWKGQAGNQGLHTAMNLVLNKNFSAEINYLFGRGTGFSLGIMQFSLLRVHGNLHFSYFQPLGHLNPFNAQRFEIYLNLYK